MKNKKAVLIIFFIFIFSISLFANQKKYFIINKIQNLNFTNNFINLIKIKSFIIPSDYNQNNSLNSIFFLKSSKDIITNKMSSVPELNPDLIIIFSFIKSLYYIIKFEINLYKYNKLILFENYNRIKPYFNINFKNKMINVGFNINI